MADTLYTVGHSNGTIERLVHLLQKHSVSAVADVRSQPYSRFNPQFNRETLAHALKGVNLEYVFLGDELGARSQDPASYRNGQAQYSLIARTSAFEGGVARLRAGMQRFCVAILCAEKEPLMCHRGILISPVLQRAGIRVLHILEDGSLESHDLSEQRLLRLQGLEEGDLFRSREELIAIAYEKQAAEIQFSSEHTQGTRL